jgi:hypothetical protein
MSDDPDDFDVDTPYLRAKVEILIPGLRLPTNEKKLLGELIDAIEQVGMILFRNHDPDGFALWEANRHDEEDDDEDDEDDDEPGDTETDLPSMRGVDMAGQPGLHPVSVQHNDDEEDRPVQAKVIPFRKSGS